MRLGTSRWDSPSHFSGTFAPNEIEACLKTHKKACDNEYSDAILQARRAAFPEALRGLHSTDCVPDEVGPVRVFLGEG